MSQCSRKNKYAFHIQHAKEKYNAKLIKTNAVIELLQRSRENRIFTDECAFSKTS